MSKEEVKTDKIVAVKFLRPCQVNERMYREGEVAGFDQKIADKAVEQKFAEVVKK